MTEMTTPTPDPRDDTAAADQVRAGIATASAHAKAAFSRIPARYRTPAARRGGALALLLTGAAIVGWQAFGPDAPSEVARTLTSVTDAAKVAAVAAADADALPAMPGDPVVSAALTNPPTRQLTAVRETQATTSAGPCMVTVDAMSLAGALVAIDVTSPCDGGSRVDIIQGDLHVAIALDAEGFGTVELPALSPMPAVAVLVTDRDPVTVQTEVTDYSMYNRAVLHWQGAAGMELHAFEGAAGYGDEGHVSADQPRTIAHALSGNGGFMSQIGDAGMDDARAALVYTAPRGVAAELSIEAAVTDANCGQTIYGGTIQTGPGIPAATQEVTMTMPGCDAVGDYVMLGDLIPAIAVASN